METTSPSIRDRVSASSEKRDDRDSKRSVYLHSFRFQVAPFPRAGVKPDLILAVVFHRVHGDVRMLGEGLGVDRLFGKNSNADAGGDGNGVALDLKRRR